MKLYRGKIDHAKNYLFSDTHVDPNGNYHHWSGQVFPEYNVMKMRSIITSMETSSDNAELKEFGKNYYVVVDGDKNIVNYNVGEALIDLLG